MKTHVDLRFKCEECKREFYSVFKTPRCLDCELQRDIREDCDE